MRKLLIINRVAFGELTDSYMWCKYLKDRYDITFISFDALGNKDERGEMDGVNIKYVSRSGGKAISELRFLIVALWYSMLSKGVIFVVYFHGAIWLKRILFWKKMNLDIRSLSVNMYPRYRKKSNKKIFNATRIYDHITIASDGLRSRVEQQGAKISILPLGAEVMSSANIGFDKIKLLYIGTLYGRSIDKTIVGLKHFIENNPDVDITYDIVGEGYYEELWELKKLATCLSLNDIISFHGKLSHGKLKPFLDKCNVGVSFVPKTDYYEFQPPTKTFEYIISGLYTIATSTYCNNEVVNANNGVLIGDGCMDFTGALEYIWARRESIDYDKIKSSLVYYKWDNIINNTLVPILEKM